MEHYSCPYPLTRGTRTVRPSGKVQWWSYDGIGPPGPETRSENRALRLSQAEVAELRALIESHKYRDFPERFDPYPPRQSSQTDACSRSIEAPVDGKSKRVSYTDGLTTERLDAFVRAVEQVINRHQWEDDPRSWEEK